MLTLVKEAVSAFSSPLAMALVLVCAAAAFGRFGRRRIGRSLFVTAALVAFLGSIRPVSDALLGPLERGYAALASPPTAHDIVVLGSGYAPRADVPVTGALDAAGLARLAEGLRLWGQHRGARLVLSGGARPGRVPAAAGYAEAARALGVPADSIALLDKPLDTGDEAVAVTAMLGGAPFVLVTSAYHMPRAIRLMERAGARPIPAPTHQQVDSSAPLGWRDWLPNGRDLRKTEAAMHEYLGLAALELGID